MTYISQNILELKKNMYYQSQASEHAQWFPISFSIPNFVSNLETTEYFHLSVSETPQTWQIQAFIYLFIYLFSESMSMGGAEKERQKENPKQAPHCQQREPDAGLELMTARSWPELKWRVRRLIDWAAQGPLD